MKLETKLGIGKGILILAMLISASVASMRLLSVGQMAREMGTQRRPFIVTVETLRNRSVAIAPLSLCNRPFLSAPQPATQSLP